MSRTFRAYAIAFIAFAAGCGGEAPSSGVATPPDALVPESDSQEKPATGPAGDLACNIESMDGKKFAQESLSVSAGAPRRVSGWVVDMKSRNVPRDAEIVLVAGDGSTVKSQRIQMWRTRNDVVSAKGDDPAYAESGFAVDLNLSEMAPGQYELIIRSAQAGPATCDVGRSIHVESLPSAPPSEEWNRT